MTGPFFERYRPGATNGARRLAGPDLVIRPAVPADVEDLARLASDRDGQDAREHAAKLEPTLARQAAAKLEPALARPAGRSGVDEGLILTAEHAGRIVGFARTTKFAPPENPPPNIAPAGWYLAGVIVAAAYRRRGIGRRLTAARLEIIAERDRWAYYLANARNQVSIDLHREFGFVEFSRDFVYPGVTFRGGAGILFRADLRTGGV